MKILIRKSDNVVIYAQDDLQLDAEAHGDGWHDQNFNLANASLENATPPEDWIGGAYSYDGDWTMIDADRVAAFRTAKRKALVPVSVSKFQAKAALLNAGHLSAVEAIMANPATPELMRLAWVEAQEFRRDSPTVAAMAAALGLSEEDVDNLFIYAMGVTA